jgi:hypothetical protein
MLKTTVHLFFLFSSAKGLVMIYIKIKPKDIPWVIISWVILCIVLGYFTGRLNVILPGMGFILAGLGTFYLIFRKRPKQTK